MEDSAKQDSWVPETPGKPSVARVEHVYIRRQFKKNPNESFLARIVQREISSKTSTSSLNGNKDDQPQHVETPTGGPAASSSQNHSVNKRKNDEKNVFKRKKRRKAHRPKVVVDRPIVGANGKVVQILQPKTPKRATPKRVGKKRSGVIAGANSAAKSRRVLKFDFEDGQTEVQFIAVKAHTHPVQNMWKKSTLVPMDWSCHGLRSSRNYHRHAYKSIFGAYTSLSIIRKFGLNFPKTCKRQRTQRKQKVYSSVVNKVNSIEVMPTANTSMVQMERKRSKNLSLITTAECNRLPAILLTRQEVESNNEIISENILRTPDSLSLSTSLKLPEVEADEIKRIDDLERTIERMIGEPSQNFLNMSVIDLNLPTTPTVPRLEAYKDAMHDRIVSEQCTGLHASSVNSEGPNLQHERSPSKLDVTGSTFLCPGPKDILHKEEFDSSLTENLPYIVQQLECLNINDGGSQLVVQESDVHGLQSKSGTIIPHKDRKKPKKLKTYLDLSGIEKSWNQIMKIGDCSSQDKANEETVEWWEQERKVFHGRICAFISRMHEIQGDRRFKQWKGSVVDSVIGVFLTQNVTDHFSSSAYMSLASKFPAQTRSNHETSEEDLEINESQKSNESCVTLGELVYDSQGNHYFVSQPAEAEVDTSQELETETVTPLIEEEGATDESKENCNELQTGTAIPLVEEEGVTDESIENIQLWMEGVNQMPNLKMVNVLQGTNKLLSSHDCSDSSENIRHHSDVGFTEFLERSQAKHVDHEDNARAVETNIANIKKVPPNAQDEEMVVSNSLVTPESISLEEVTIGKNSQVSSCPQGGPINSPSESRPAYAITNPKKPLRKGRKVKSNKEEISSDLEYVNTNKGPSRRRKEQGKKKQAEPFDWDSLRKRYSTGRQRGRDQMDFVDWEAVRRAEHSEVAEAIKQRGQQSVLAGRIQDLLNRVVQLHGSIDLEWLRDIPPDESKRYLLEVQGLGLKSVECVRLLALQQVAFPVDTNVARITVRLGWVPLKPLQDGLRLHELADYPSTDSIQKYLWPRLSTLDHKTLYELHYQMITFGKVFCTKKKPNCNACPLRGECKHFASAFASSRLALPGSSDKRVATATMPVAVENPYMVFKQASVSLIEANLLSGSEHQPNHCIPIIEEPLDSDSELDESSEPEEPLDLECDVSAEPAERLDSECEESYGPAEVVCAKSLESDIEDLLKEDKSEIPTIKMNMEEVVCAKSLEIDIEDLLKDDQNEIPTIEMDREVFRSNVRNFLLQDGNMILQDGDDVSTALVALTPEAASIPESKLKNASRLRTEHQVYELPDSHPLLQGLPRRVRDDPTPYLLAIWTPGETANSFEQPKKTCTQESGLCNDQTCFSCNCIREQNSGTIRGTILIPCRTAMQASFPLNGTYFQVNEVFADHETSNNPLIVPRKLIWNLRMRTVYFGTSTSSLTRGLSTREIQLSFWRGFICVRGFERETMTTTELSERLHVSTSKSQSLKAKKNRKEKKTK
ncbi:transcriptional activator DEMETER isoform X2 [Tripterygium wilfordii]|uniref:Transcriptional activator DEMETER isoform X2 n=1 Tax=Tripterygium wilfordii TaxID=458696 RepID=A0A7J7C087_TRIWF|nr:DNA glycosylase/AP lyase ROS1-like [Tripterygium wilfordii]XP_038693420.1 DNA glycosylase/AP lyase ROS1-like [Tripterygium wilfordii]XP_038693421.1 DNA glycosylase/AP lyase ROS1-like [Tripterygium wilfordii]KAF5727508.1 transcriptional activator DEMETER isoform X2 [Tripterygium wilfordii]